MFFISFLASMYSYGKESYINTISKTTLNNIEIVSPYISDYDYKLLSQDSILSNPFMTLILSQMTLRESLKRMD